VKPIEIMPLMTTRNCFRCGKEFQSGSGNRICSDCCRPKEQEIAYELHLTEGTIKEYLNRIFRKLGVSNRTELAVWALTHHASRAVQQECVA